MWLKAWLFLLIGILSAARARCASFQNNAVLFNGHIPALASGVPLVGHPTSFFASVCAKGLVEARLYWRMAVAQNGASS